MSSVGLLFVGAALFVNGLLFLGRVDAKTAGVFNLFVGALQTAIPFYLIATATDPDQVLAASGVFMFGFTYLWVGVNNLAGYTGNGLGWYSAWVSLMAVGFAVTNLVRFDDAASALLWAQWSVLWGMFFVVIGLGRTRWTALAGWTTLVMAITTCTVPAFVYLLGYAVPAWAIAASIVVTAVGLTPLAVRTATGRADGTATTEPAATESAGAEQAGAEPPAAEPVLARV
ncbi:AmiS/UreI family transporter [Nocardioides sp. CFH 31398]|uniref:AmiS/UreI family transporter n=1 Tax=Nocardioides sp. CFH 31398 TaxID=2919579 RepID=UPI001F05C763|nr:AmiS/UreI family transporter [Nocardioides sp. CFH 31398]MCH1865683.1 AmiS/UreI family transporter [Nocardioides sp. CFH 31398]